MKIKDLMTTNVSCCQETDAVQSAAQMMEQNDCGSVPVCDAQGKVVGMLTDRDIVLGVVAKGRPDAKVSDCMSRHVVTCTPDTDAHEAADLMAQFQIRRLPVVDSDQKLCGIVAIADLATINIHINEAGEALSKISVESPTPNAVQ